MAPTYAVTEMFKLPFIQRWRTTGFSNIIEFIRALVALNPQIHASTRKAIPKVVISKKFSEPPGALPFDLKPAFQFN